MKAISRALDRFCYNHPRLGIPQLMKYIALGNVAVFIADMLMNGLVSYWIAFVPELILRGQIWRLVTFVFVPVSSGGYTIFGQMFFFALATFFYYWIGTALERQWGTTRFTVFYGLGVVLNIVAGFVIYAVLVGQLTGAGLPAGQNQGAGRFNGQRRSHNKCDHGADVGKIVHSNGFFGNIQTAQAHLFPDCHIEKGNQRYETQPSALNQGQNYPLSKRRPI